MTIGADGSVTIGAMPSDAKAMKAMMHKGKAMRKGSMVIFMDDKENIYSYHETGGKG